MGGVIILVQPPGTGIFQAPKNKLIAQGELRASRGYARDNQGRNAVRKQRDTAQIAIGLNYVYDG
jgi:hypothetical protein